MLFRSPTITWDNSTHGTWAQEYAVSNGTSVLAGLQAKIADGTEDSGTLGITLSASEGFKAFAICIQDWFGTLEIGRASCRERV